MEELQKIRLQEALTRTEAAAYCGFGVTTFDKMDKSGLAPPSFYPPGSSDRHWRRLSLDLWLIELERTGELSQYQRLKTAYIVAYASEDDWNVKDILLVRNLLWLKWAATRLNENKCPNAPAGFIEATNDSRRVLRGSLATILKAVRGLQIAYKELETKNVLNPLPNTRIAQQPAMGNTQGMGPRTRQRSLRKLP